MKLLLAVGLLSACIAAGTARADGDPASDYLLSQKVFFPFEAKIPKAKQQELLASSKRLRRRDIPIRAALIGSAYPSERSPLGLGQAANVCPVPRRRARLRLQTATAGP